MHKVKIKPVTISSGLNLQVINLKTTSCRQSLFSLLVRSLNNGIEQRDAEQMHGWIWLGLIEMTLEGSWKEMVGCNQNQSNSLSDAGGQLNWEHADHADAPRQG